MYGSVRGIYASMFLKVLRFTVRGICSSLHVVSRFGDARFTVPGSMLHAFRGCMFFEVLRITVRGI